MRTIACILAAVLLLGGCSSSNSAGESASGPGGAAKVVAPPGGGAADSPRAAQNIRLSQQSIIYTAKLDIRSGDVPAAASRAKQLVAAAGGYVGDEESENSPGSPPSATITFKIPSARYAEVLGQLGSDRIGERTSLQQQAEDVTQQVADVNSRVTSAKAALASFRSLLGKATSISEITRLEQEIAQRESDLESLQARQRSLAHETAFATVTLRIQGTKTAAATAKHHHRHGFTGGLAAGWHAFTAFLGVVALVVGWLLPFLPLIALIALAALWYRRRRRSRESAPQHP